MSDSPLETFLAAVPGNPLQGLRQADRLWEKIRHGKPLGEPLLANPWVTDTSTSDLLPIVEWDVVVGGGTLGIIVGTVLAQQGWRVAVVERGMLRGRDQEWNISRHELQVLVELEILTAAALEDTIASEYNPGRIAFGDGPEIWVRDVLNVGVSPVALLERVKQRFLAVGGTLLEQTALTGAIVHANGVAIGAQRQGETFTLTSRLFLDSLGHFSPVAQQARAAAGILKPDSVCLVVGSCAQGFPRNETGDLFVSCTPIVEHCQFFWEAFPARDGRTTYLFTYLDAHPDRPSLEKILEHYYELLPQYQGIEWSALQVQRVLFGLLPAYRRSPLAPGWDRMLSIGDSSGLQSPLSFGGFGALLRHLSRLSSTLKEALQGDFLDRSALAWINGYQPNLSVTWLFQRTMSVGLEQDLNPDQVNRLLAAVFQVLNASGDAVLRPFLQDVIQWEALTPTLMQTGLRYPLTIASVLPQVGFGSLLDWTKHYFNLSGYRALFPLSRALTPWIDRLEDDRLRHRLRCWQRTLEYGCGQDYRGL